MSAADKEALKAQVAFSAKHQGRRQDPFTGEEPGKIHHEIDPSNLRGVLLNGLETTYNACDNNALFLLAIARLVEMGEPEILPIYAANIEAAIGYIHTHLKNNIFYEDPKFAGLQNKRFALGVTYWKDSVINSEEEEPTYPIVYSLPHFQNAAALRQIGNIMNRPELVQTGQDMEQAGIDRLWRAGHFVTAIDGAQRVIDPPSSDSLHALLYVEQDALPEDAAAAIEDYMIDLETEAGYRTGKPINGISDDYHTGYVWTHEQAILHSAAQKHKLKRAKAVASRIVPHFNGKFPELINAEDLSQAGNPIQLWAVGASIYFSSLAKIRH